jgi:hypothetical protein
VRPTFLILAPVQQALKKNASAKGAKMKHCFLMIFQFPKYIHYEEDENAQKIVNDHPNLYQKYMHKQMELQREKERPERKRAASSQNGQQTKVRKSQ